MVHAYMYSDMWEFKGATKGTNRIDPDRYDLLWHEGSQCHPKGAARGNTCNCLSALTLARLTLARASPSLGSWAQVWCPCVPVWPLCPDAPQVRHPCVCVTWITFMYIAVNLPLEYLTVIVMIRYAAQKSLRRTHEHYSLQIICDPNQWLFLQTLCDFYFVNHLRPTCSACNELKCYLHTHALNRQGRVRIPLLGTLRCQWMEQ